jgi:hypothetical protein
MIKGVPREPWAALRSFGKVSMYNKYTFDLAKLASLVHEPLDPPCRYGEAAQENDGCVALRLEFRSCTNCALPHSSLVRLALLSLDPPCTRWWLDGKTTTPWTRPVRLWLKKHRILEPLVGGWIGENLPLCPSFPKKQESKGLFRVGLIQSVITTLRLSYRIIIKNIC